MSNGMLWLVSFIMFALNLWRRFSDLNNDNDMSAKIVLSQAFFVAALGSFDLISGFQVLFIISGSWWAVKIGLGKKQFGIDEGEE